MTRTYDEKEKAIRITASYQDFDGNLERWKDSFYTLWRYQLTFEFAHKLTLNETRRGVFIDAIIKPCYLSNIKETMHDLGYKNIKTEETEVGFVCAYDRKDCENISALILDY